METEKQKSVIGTDEWLYERAKETEGDKVFLPSPALIKERKSQIQETWDKKEELRRRSISNPEVDISTTLQLQAYRRKHNHVNKST